MKLLIVNTLPKENEEVLSAIKVFQENADISCRTVHVYERDLKPCIGCNACWLVTPGICSVKDGYEELLKAYLGSDAVLFLSGTALRFVDHRMKNVIDRLLPLVTMGVEIKNGECRHVPRYRKKLRFGLLYSGEADGAYLDQWMERVMLNFGGESLGAYPVSQAKEVLSCI